MEVPFHTNHIERGLYRNLAQSFSTKAEIGTLVKSTLSHVLAKVGALLLTSQTHI